MRPRILATDLDGTLLNQEGELTDRTVAAISRLDRLGIEMVWATARSPRDVHALAARASFENTAICSNGAMIWDYGIHRMVDQRFLTATTAAEITAGLATLIPGTGFGYEFGDALVVDTSFGWRQFRRTATSGPSELRDRVAAQRRPIFKVLAWLPGAVSSSMLKRVTAIIGDAATVTWSGQPRLLEIGPATKASALRKLCRDRSVRASEVIYIGDMPNDIEAMRWAGMSYAMANGDPSTHRIAKAIAPDHCRDGVAHVIDLLIESAGQLPTLSCPAASNPRWEN
jgi:Cof subfamily protein (haloacid dehalogenase superfamily)